MNSDRVVDIFPLSPMQQGMLFHHLKEPHSGVDIEQLVVHLSENVDHVRMAAAWQWLINRHDILRVQFAWDGVPQPEQRVLSVAKTPFIVEDHRTSSKDVQRNELTKFLEEDRRLGFEMDTGPMLRLALFQWAEESFSLVWTFHHALLDGRSYPPLLREVMEAYTELGMGEIAPRPEPFPYRRYVDWLQGENFAAAESYWRDLLKGLSAPTPLVVDRLQVVSTTANRQGEAWESVGRETTGQLRKFAAGNGLTMNAVVMGAWAILLHRYSGEEDIVFGATRACRKSSIPNADETIGLFINTVPVRARISGSATALSVLQFIRRQWLEMRPYEHTPLSRLKGLTRVPANHSLFESLLVFENYKLDAAMRSMGGAWSTREIELHELTNFPITLAAYDGDALDFKIEFDTRRLDEETIRRLLGHLHQILRGIAADPQAAIQALPLITEAEYRELTGEFAKPLAVPAKTRLPLDGGATLHELFEAQVAARPHATALTCGRQALSYERVNALANRLARRLVEHGVGPDVLVGLCLDRSNDLVIAILAILKAGGAYLPIDLAYPAERLTFMLDDARAPVLLTSSGLAGSLPETQARVLNVDESLAAEAEAGEDANLEHRASPDHLAYVIYTSGTTGKPKGSLITHRNVVRLLPATEHWYGFDENDVWTLFHSCAFDFSVWEIWGALLYGGRVVVVPFMVSRSPEAFYELLASEGVTVLNQTPSAFRQLIQAEEAVGQKELSLRYVIFGGEALEMQSLRPWFEWHGDTQPQLVNMYGITETTVHVTYRPISKEDLNSGSVIGVPIPDLQIYILDALRQPLPIGIPGEMYVGGAGLARGYLRRPELTDERFVPDHLSGQPGSRLYRTGDLARFLPGHDIEYLGRIDHQVKIRGFRIELGEIESVLCQHPQVREAAVIAREDTPGSKRLVAYLVCAQPAPEVTGLREHLKTSLPEYMVPAAFVFLDAFPLTNNGKIDRQALPVPEQRPELASRYVGPRTLAEEKLASIWAKVLRLERVGVNDNFFELGGDSILSIQVISLARREGMKLTPGLLFAHQTIAELALAAREAIQETPASDEAMGDVPLTPIQHWFLEQELSDPHHYNQSFLFEVAERLERAPLESALAEVGRHHDALRMKFTRESGWWRQYYDAAAGAPAFDWIDVQSGASIETVAASLQSGLNFETGPLWRAAYFDAGPTAPGKLLLVVHHLVIDGVSWRPLMEDLEQAYLSVTAGRPLQLPAKTSSFKAWASKLNGIGRSDSFFSELPYWQSVSATRTDPQSGGVEESARTLSVSLDAAATEALLKQVPVAYNTQINDALLTALTRAWSIASGNRTLAANLEGHGREGLFDDIDLSRTIGWFTSIFPIRLELPGDGSGWKPGEALKSIKEQIRQVPRRGIGYGVVRYLSGDSTLSGQPDTPILFNYLGQFDRVLEGSKLFRFAPESSGPWHSPSQQRRYALEVNSLVIDGRLEVRWTYNPRLQPDDAVKTLAAGFLDALRELTAHCLSTEAGGRTPSDFSLVRLDQPTLDRLLTSHRGIEDICPLSPIQTLFYSASPGDIHSTFDQWHCTLRGNLDVGHFQNAWLETVRRHTILRSTIHGDGLQQPLQLVHRDVTLPWLVEDWRSKPDGQKRELWVEYLAQDLGTPIDLTVAPTMRFSLVRLAGDEWKFLWSVPALLLDGWSWPLVFREMSLRYEALSKEAMLQFEPVLPYSDYLAWLANQSGDPSREFWRRTLAGFGQPTPLPRESAGPPAGGKRFEDLQVPVSQDTSKSLHQAARQRQVTLNTLVQAAWGILLGRQSGHSDIVFGAAFAGRPAELHGAESIVGPFVNNLPIRVTLDGQETVGAFLRRLHSQLLELSAHQFLPVMEIQRVSEVPWRHRLFESLVVFQNYLVDESARRLGGCIGIENFAGPIHTNFPMMLLAQPGDRISLSLTYDRRTVTGTTAELWTRELGILLEQMPAYLDRAVFSLQDLLSKPAVIASSAKARLSPQEQVTSPPQTETEKAIAGVWQSLFDVTDVDVERNFFELGGHSLLLVQMHGRLRETLDVHFPIVALFEHPTIRSLAQHLTQPAPATSQSTQQWLDRAQKRKLAMSQMRQGPRS